MDGFNKSLEELLHFADSLKLREKELEQQRCLEFEKQKNEYDIQLQIEKRRSEQLQEINRTLTEQVERGTQKQVELEQKHSVTIQESIENRLILICLGFSNKI
jgi:HD superfamily phosphodiesterase